MSDHSVLLDAFAESRRTWDEVVSLQPDIAAARAGGLQDVDVAELTRRVQAHRASVDMLAEALETAEPVKRKGRS